MKYKHFSIEEREKIQYMLWEKKSVPYIAKELGRSPSSVSREIKRNLPKERHRYTPRVANERAIIKRSCRGREERLKNDTIRDYVASKLKGGLSPEQIAGRLPTDHPECTISHEAIYQFIYAQVYREGHGYLKPGCEDLRMYLKRRHKRRIPKGARRCKRVWKPKGVSIDKRPKEVELRKIIGHWEGDSVVSGKSRVGLNTLVERVSGLVMISKLRDGTAEETGNAVQRRLSVFPTTVRKTLTLDNGSENACWKELEQSLSELSCYFAHPYSSWERGTNENTNGLIRWYFPKGTDFATVSDEEIAAVEYSLNTRPRKCLNWKTPLEVFTESVALQG